MSKKSSFREWPMIIKDGTRRRAFLFPDEGIVIKMPKFPEGKRQNLAEFEFWQSTEHPFLVPTLQVLREGIAVIQELQQPCWMHDLDFQYQMKDILGSAMVIDSHHFLSKENFTFDCTGQLRICDYGSPATRIMIQIHGRRIMAKFDPAYCHVEPFLSRLTGWSDEKKGKYREFYAEQMKKVHERRTETF